MKTLLEISILLIIAFVFSGCIDEPVQQENYLVKGQIFDWGSGHLISTNSYPIVGTGGQGFFEINALKPYKLTITTTDYPNVLKYDNINKDYTNIVSYDKMPVHYFLPSCNLYVYFPASAEGKYVCTKFISTDPFICTDNFQPVHGNNFNKIRVHIPGGKTQITGKIYYLEASINFSGIFSFDRYGIKDNITLYPGANPDIYFSDDELSYNPPEIVATVDINVPADKRVYFSSISLSSVGYHKSSDLPLLEVYERTHHYPVVIPIFPGNDFKIKILYEYVNIDFVDAGYSGKQWKYVNPGEPLNINLNNTFEALLPMQGTDKVIDSTTFEISDNLGPAIYQYSLIQENYPYSTIRLHTDKKKIKFQDFRARGFEPLPNTTYYWHVRKYPGYFNIDEFLSQPYPLDDRYDYIELSKVRTFTTAP